MAHEVLYNISGSALYWCHTGILSQGYLFTLCSPPLVSRDELSACLHYTLLLSLMTISQFQSTWSMYSILRSVLQSTLFTVCEWLILRVQKSILWSTSVYWFRTIQTTHSGGSPFHHKSLSYPLEPHLTVENSFVIVFSALEIQLWHSRIDS